MPWLSITVFLHLNGNSQLSSNTPPMPCLPPPPPHPQRLNIDRCISISIITSISTRKTNMFVFLVLMLVLMRLCLCLCASENSIRQIGGFLLIFLLCLRLCRGCSHLLRLCCAYALERATASFMTAMTWTLVFSVPCEK